MMKKYLPGVYHLLVLLYHREILALPLLCLFSLFKPEDASSAGFYLPEGCLPQSLPFLSYCWPVSEEDVRMYVLKSEFWGVCSLLGK